MENIESEKLEEKNSIVEEHEEGAKDKLVILLMLVCWVVAVSVIMFARHSER